MSDQDTTLRGADKKEAFHEAAEARIQTFKFEVPGNIPDNTKAHVKLAGTDTCRASVQVLRNGGDNNLHYHPNMDLIYMVLKGTVRFYGPDDKVIGDYGPNEGLLLPENSRYWFKSMGEDEAWLLQMAGYPKGAKASKRIPVEAVKANQKGGFWVGMSEEEHKIRKQNNQL